MATRDNTPQYNCFTAWGDSMQGDGTWSRHIYTDNQGTEHDYWVCQAVAGSMTGYAADVPATNFGDTEQHKYQVAMHC